MIRKELVKEIRIVLDDESAEQYASARIVSALNGCLRTLWFKALKVRPSYGETTANLATVLNVDRITLPTDFLSPIRVEHATDQAPLDRWDWPADPRLLDADEPWEYRIEGTQIVFRAPADAVYNLTLYYRKLVPTMTTDAATTGLPEYFDQVLIERTAKKLGARLDVDELERDEREALNVFTDITTYTSGYSAKKRMR